MLRANRILIVEDDGVVDTPHRISNTVRNRQLSETLRRLATPPAPPQSARIPLVVDVGRVSYGLD